MINVGIVGATGHTGELLIGILLKHPQARITGLYNTGSDSKLISEAFPKFKNQINLIVKKLDVKELCGKCDIIFLALPHTVSMSVVPILLKAGKRVIDLSADYRLQDHKIYQQFYNSKHTDVANIKDSVYGLPELYREKIKSAKLVANPGCYPTAAVLALAPLVAVDAVDTFAPLSINLERSRRIDLGSIIIDAKSGVSGAGKKLSQELLFGEVDEDFKAYKVGTHQHTPEIEQILSKLAGKKIKVTLTPHLLPLDRGILETIYVKKAPAGRHGKTQSAINLYKKFYKNEPFVRIYEEGNFPRIKDVAYTNFCDIGLKEEPDKIIIIVAIDNLMKGASGQAVQNMNIMFGLTEQAALL